MAVSAAPIQHLPHLIIIGGNLPYAVGGQGHLPSLEEEGEQWAASWRARGEFGEARRAEREFKEAGDQERAG